MHLSRYFLPLIKENPAEAVTPSHRLMLRAGMIRQLTSGVYSWLPLGLKVLRKTSDIIRDELDKAGAQELLMPTIQPAELWKESGRGDYGKETLHITDRHGRDMIYGPTNEEVITDIFRSNIRSYKELPLCLYHIQWKFRDEIRPRFGVMRGREFLMKDAYTFDVDEARAREAYEDIFRTYLRIFNRFGVQALPLRANTGMMGGNLSHEFHIVAGTGESEIFYDEALPDAVRSNPDDIAHIRSFYAEADERHVPADCPLPQERLRSSRGIEVGHIFYYGTKYSAPMKALITGEDGSNTEVHMGAHGIGVSRLVGAMIEAGFDDGGIIWPSREVAPFDASVINLKPGHAQCDNISKMAYDQLRGQSLDVLYDDRRESAGVKFATSELIGVPWHIVIGPKGVERGVVELRERATGAREEISLESAISRLSKLS